MPLLRSIHTPATRDKLLLRLDGLQPDSPRRWGRMTPHGMMCHVADLFRVAVGERESRMLEGPLLHSLARWWGVTAPVRWPHGFPTLRSLDQERDGTPPGDFEQDRQALVALIHRFSDPAVPLGSHPLFGPLSRSEWGRWGFRHTHHHLRQFGL